jgi:predicted DNA-binding transcriptional regulator AlpA
VLLPGGEGVQDQDELLGYDQVARKCRKSRRTIEAWAIGRGTPEGFPRPFHLGRHARWRPSDINAFIDRLAAEANGNHPTVAKQTARSTRSRSPTMPAAVKPARRSPAKRIPAKRAGKGAPRKR